MSYTWGSERRFNAYNSQVKKLFGNRIQKIALDAGFTCPNRDGRKGTGGCTFCLNTAFNPSYCSSTKSVTQQLSDGILFHQNRRHGTFKYLAYFQAYSNTYADVDTLQRLYSEALSHPEICGLVIGTRPDCLNDDILNLIAEIRQKNYVSLEIGLESCRDQTLKRINRGHDWACSLQAMELIRAHGLTASAHLIFGLPGESPANWFEDLKTINQAPLHSIKFHQLQIIKGTAMEKEFRERPEDFHRFSLDEYVDFITEYISKLSSNIAIERMASEVPSRYLAVSGWGGTTYDQILKRVEQQLESRDVWQGKYA